jgi:Spy/CpxP family protein refolding chaperone
MSIRNFFVLILTICAFSSLALAQGGQPNQPNQPNQSPRDGFGRRGDGSGRGGRGFGDGQQRRGIEMMQQRRMHIGGGMNDFRRLNLTDTQKQRIQTVLENNRRTAETSQAQFEEMRRLMQLRHQGLLTTEQGTRLTSLEAQMSGNRDRMRNEILAVLTAEQKTLFEQMQNQRGPGMRGMRERMLQRRGPAGQIGPRGGPRGGGGNPSQPRQNMQR